MFIIESIFDGLNTSLVVGENAESIRFMNVPEDGADRSFLASCNTNKGSSYGHIPNSGCGAFGICFQEAETPNDPSNPGVIYCHCTSPRDAKVLFTGKSGCPTPTQSPTFATCETIGGFAEENSPCEFPFTMGGQEYSECVSMDVAQPYLGTSVQKPNMPTGNLGNTKYWCSTIREYSSTAPGVRKNWGFCSSTCGYPVDEDGRTTTFVPTFESTNSPTAESAAPTVAPTIPLQKLVIDATWTSTQGSISIPIPEPLQSQNTANCSIDRGSCNSKPFPCDRVFSSVGLSATELLCAWENSARMRVLSPLAGVPWSPGFGVGEWNKTFIAFSFRTEHFTDGLGKTDKPDADSRPAKLSNIRFISFPLG